MIDGTIDTYSEFKYFLKTKKPNLNSLKLIVNFENAFISMFKENFLEMKLKVVFYILCNVMKIQNNELQTIYDQDFKFSLHVLLLCLLAFISPSIVNINF